jgi:phosphoribosylformylglycinamidine synthase
VKVAIVKFPGSTGDGDVLDACARVLAPEGAESAIVWHGEADLGGADLVVLPGGPSYGGAASAAALVAESPIVGAVKAHAERGGWVLAVGAGFQVACAAGLLEGRLEPNRSGRLDCRDVHVRVEGRPTPFTQAIPAGRVLRMSIAHAEGRYAHPDPERLERDGLVVFRYVAPDGRLVLEANPDGSLANIAGVTCARGNVVGLMPHPERAVEMLLGEGGEDGRRLFESALAAAAGTPARVGP